MSTLVVTAYTPALGSGRALRTYGVVAALARHGPVDVLYRRFDGPAPDPAYAALDGVALHEVDAAARGPRRLAAAGAAIARGVPPGLARSVTPELARRATELAPGAGRVVADGPPGVATLLGLARRRPIVYLAHNLESAHRPTPGLARFERGVLETCAESWMATAADVRGARALAPGARLRHAPNVVDVARIAPQAAAPGGARILLVADFTYAPNREGLDLLAGEVLPRVRAAVPDATIVAVGRGLDPAEAPPGVEVRGFVSAAELEAAYAQAAAVAVPMVRGGGSPLKFVEALAHAVPVVATEHAGALLEDGRAGEHFLAAGDTDGLAGAFVTVLRGGGRDVAAAGRALAERAYSVEALASALAS